VEPLLIVGLPELQIPTVYLTFLRINGGEKCVLQNDILAKECYKLNDWFLWVASRIATTNYTCT